MEESKKVNSGDKVSSYVVPVYLLSALIMNTDKPDSINDTILDLLKKVSDSEEVKKIFAETSKNLTEAISNLSEGIHLLLVPNTVIPVKEKQDSDIAIDFVEKFNEALAKYMEQGNEK